MYNTIYNITNTSNKELCWGEKMTVKRLVKQLTKTSIELQLILYACTKYIWIEIYV